MDYFSTVECHLVLQFTGNVSGKIICRLGYCVDNILIASRTFTVHVAHLKSVLERLQQAGLRVKPSKYAFAEEKIAYIGLCAVT